MLPLRARLDLGAMTMKEVLHIPQSSSIIEPSQSDCLVSYPEHSIRESYPPAEKQSVDSTTHVYWATTLKTFEKIIFFPLKTFSPDDVLSSKLVEDNHIIKALPY